LGLFAFQGKSLTPLPASPNRQILDLMISKAPLSMGMSGDDEAAIQIGATHVRLGGAFFGVGGRGEIWS
jgi:uncharacterized pyridoxal phosphate-containing UPF0001 family protein